MPAEDPFADMPARAIPPAKVIPFGKYRNQPLAALAQDREYREWLLGQDWFVQRYPDIHTIIINNFGEPSETPEHNALQLRFLGEDVRLRCAALVFTFQKYAKADQFYWNAALPFQSMSTPVFEAGGADVDWYARYWLPPNPAQQTIKRSYNVQTSPRIVHIPAHWPTQIFSYLCSVECKPSLGDDYPQVLRFMKSLKTPSNILCVGTYAFQGGSLPQVRAFFATSDILLCSLDEILATPLPWVVPSHDLLPDATAFLAQVQERKDATP